jgi:hypothetical protein
LFIFAAPLLFVWLAYVRFTRRIQRRIGTLLHDAVRKPSAPVVTEAMLEKLPPPVQRYLRFSGVVGKPIPTTVHLKQIGKIRRAPDQAWLKINAEEFYSVNPPAFVWSAKAGGLGLPIMRGSDELMDGHGHMQIRLMGLIPLVDAQGEQMDQGTLMRYLNEMTWFPAAFLNENVSWKAIDDNSAEVTLTDHGKTVSAVLYFDQVGRLNDFVADRYYQIDNGKSYEIRKWSTPFTEYGEMAGLNLPIKGKAVWKLDDGDFEYIELEVTGIEYVN